MILRRILSLWYTISHFTLILSLVIISGCDKDRETVIAVESVSIKQDLLTLVIDESQSLVAIVLPTNATNKIVTWTSSDTAVATVSSSGIVKGVAKGKATITASVGGKSSSCTITVNSQVVEVTEISLNKSLLTLVVGGNETFVATVLPMDATNKELTWTSSAPAVATVDSTGKVMALTVGTTTITASVEGGKSDTSTVTVIAGNVVVDSVKLNKAALKLSAGSSETLTATVLPNNATNKTVTWVSSAPAVATVDSTGKVTGLSAGETTITASVGDKSATCAVTVIATSTTIDVTEIKLNKPTMALTVGGNETLVATVLPADATNKTVSWTSSTPGVASIDNTGKVVALTAGTATITASAEGKSATCIVTVFAISSTINVTSIILNKQSMTLSVPGEEILTATVLPANATNKTVTWTSSVPSVASVDNSGKVVGLTAGSTTITASAGGKSASCVVTVNATSGTIDVTDITLNKSTTTLTVGDNETLVATVLPANATNKTVAWTSSAPSVASVDNTGKVVALAAGSTTITALAGGKSVTCAVTVKAPLFNSENFNPGGGANQWN